MKTDDFNFELPERLIAQYPVLERGKSRLFVLNRGSDTYEHSMTTELAQFIEPGTVMVFNDTKVRKARLFGTALETGAVVEFLLLEPVIDSSGKVDASLILGLADEHKEEPYDNHGSKLWRVMTSKAKRQRKGRRYSFPEGILGLVTEELGEERVVEFSEPISEAYLERNGHIPLPPYIKRSDEADDAQRYQTVYARNTGSAACPTAGLHFTPDLMNSLHERGIELRWVTLHVGLGTFLPVRSETVENHVMHEEWYHVPKETAEAVKKAKAEGRKVLSVGTTSLRTLESASQSGEITAGPGSTSIFIYPGYQFRVVDQLFTNFHTPKSTLLMLVSAFAGRARILSAYEEAIRLEYRFFSYGDAMLIR